MGNASRKYQSISTTVISAGLSLLMQCVIFFHQLTFFNIPLICYLCWCLLLRCRGAYFRSHLKYTGWVRSGLMHIGLVGFLAWQAYSCYFLQKTYGIVAFLLSPVRTWSLALALALVYKAWNFNNSTIRTFKAEMKNCL